MINFYADTAVAVCWLMNYICIDISAGIMKIKPKKFRLIIFSLLLSVLGIFTIFNAYIRISYIFLYGIILRLIFGKSRISEQVRRYIICTSCSLLFSALFLTLIPHEKLSANIISGGIIFTADDTFFFGFLGIIYFLVKIMFFFLSCRKQIFRVGITLSGIYREAMALVDTGNSLRVPDTGEPVIFAERSLFGEINEKGRLIHCKTVSGDKNLIRILPLDDLFFTDENRHVKNIYISLTDTPLTENGNFKILLHKSIFA